MALQLHVWRVGLNLSHDYSLDNGSQYSQMEGKKKVKHDILGCIRHIISMLSGANDK